MAQKPVEWTCVPVQEFTTHRDAWNELNAQTYRSPLMDSRFVDPLLKYFSDGSELLCLGYQDDQLKVASVVRKVSFGRWQTLQAEQAPLGLWMSEPSVDLHAYLTTLSASLPGWVMQISLTQQDPKLLNRPADNSFFSTLDYITTGRLDVPEDFDTYRQGLSRNVKQNTNRAKNRIEKMGHSIHFKVVHATDNIESAVKEYGVLESKGWKAEKGTAVNISNDQGRFYLDMLSNFSPNQAEVWQYCYDDKIVATDFCIHNQSSIIILKTTYDEEWQKYSPAFCMHLDGIAHCSDLNLDEIEFYGPAMDWHKKLTDDLRTMYHVNWFKLALIKALIGKLKKLSKAVKSRRQQS